MAGLSVGMEKNICPICSKEHQRTASVFIDKRIKEEPKDLGVVYSFSCCPDCYEEDRLFLISTKGDKPLEDLKEGESIRYVLAPYEILLPKVARDIKKTERGFTMIVEDSFEMITKAFSNGKTK